MEPKRKIAKFSGLEMIKPKKQSPFNYVAYEPRMQRRYFLRILDNNRDIELYIRSTRPEMVRMANPFRFETPAAVEWAPITIKIIDIIGVGNMQHVTTYFQNWFGDVNNQLVTRNYKKDVVLESIDPTGVVVEKWDMRGTFPTAFTIDNYLDEDNLTLEVTLHMDYCTQIF